MSRLLFASVFLLGLSVSAWAGPRGPRVMPDGSILMPSGTRCPAPSGTCPTVTPTLTDLDLSHASGRFYMIAQSYRRETERQTCTRIESTGTPDGLTGRILVYDTQQSRNHDVAFTMTRPDKEGSPLLVRQEITGLDIPLYNQIIGGSTTADGLTWSVSYNCTEMERDGQTVPITTFDVTANRADVDETTMADIKRQIGDMGLDTCSMIEVPQQDNCPSFD